MKHSVAGYTCTTESSEYTNRHNKVAGYIHWTIRKLIGLYVTETYCEYIPEKVINLKGTAITWFVPVIGDRTTRLDLVLQDEKSRLVC
jgi:hypothetical protein